MIEEAERHLNQAAQADQIGRFQLEAAIQSVHAQRAWIGRTEWEAIAILYEGLIRIATTIGLLVGRAAAVSEARGAEQGMALLEAIPSQSVTSYQPYWALSAHLSKRLERYQEAHLHIVEPLGCPKPKLHASSRYSRHRKSREHNGAS